MKRIIFFCLSVLLLLTLAACAGSPEVHDEAVNELPTFPVRSEMSYDEQVELIVQCKHLWQKTDYGYSEPLKYVVTDLDRNGRLELFVTLFKVSKSNTTTELWEVAPTFDSLVLCTAEQGGSYTFLDLIGTDTLDTEATVYYDGSCYSYIFYDTTYLDGGITVTEKRSLCLADGVIYERNLGRTLTQYTQDDEVLMAYYDADGNEVDIGAYEMIEETCFEGHEMLLAKFYWHEIKDSELIQLEDSYLIGLFAQSWENFVIE